MRKWIWTFGVGSPYKGKYVVIETDNGDGREYMFNMYGRQNCCMSYPYEKGIALVEKYGYTLIEKCKIGNPMRLGNFISGFIVHNYMVDSPKHDEGYELMVDSNENNDNE